MSFLVPFLISERSPTGSTLRFAQMAILAKPGFQHPWRTLNPYPWTWSYRTPTGCPKTPIFGTPKWTPFWHFFRPRSRVGPGFETLPPHTLGPTPLYQGYQMDHLQKGVSKPVQNRSQGPQNGSFLTPPLTG
jgi:hypothetical protein